MEFHPASFRDPESGVCVEAGRVYRYFVGEAASLFNALDKSGLIASLTSRGLLIPAEVATSDKAGAVADLVPGASLVLEHPWLPFISYPYEWPFDMLKRAGLLYLDVLLATLASGHTLKDATPYNVQFVGPQPVYIDLGSFARWDEGTPWISYTQFCRMFLNPLILESRLGVPFQPLMRASLEGIEPETLARLLSLRQKLNGTVFSHIVLQSWLNKRFAARQHAARIAGQQRVGRQAVLRMVRGLRRVIASLSSRRPKSHWVSYEDDNSYSPEAQASKEAFVERALATAKPHLVWDLGCNTGRYSMIASRHADYVVAMDNDAGSVQAFYDRVAEARRNVLPLVVDLLNPSPDQGWAQAERAGLLRRGPADFALVLALVHHLCITGGIPIRGFVKWMANIAKAGVVEFVPPSDPMVERLAAWRRGNSQEYSQETFENALHQHFQILDMTTLPGSGRVLYSLRR